MKRILCKLTDWLSILFVILSHRAFKLPFSSKTLEAMDKAQRSSHYEEYGKILEGTLQYKLSSKLQMIATSLILAFRTLPYYEEEDKKDSL